MRPPGVARGCRSQAGQGLQGVRVPCAERAAGDSWESRLRWLACPPLRLEVALSWPTAVLPAPDIGFRVD